MKQLLLLTAIFTCTIKCFSQQYGLTDGGRRVILNDDKTWAYVTDSSSTVKDTSVKGSYLKPASATAILKSQRTDFGVWYNPGKWLPETRLNMASAETILHLQGQEGYCLTVAERIPVPMENLSDVIKASKRKVSTISNLNFEKEEYRIVNGIKVLHLQFSATTQGINFVYTGYFVSDDTGTYQVMCYTSKNLFAQYEKQFSDLLNGLAVVKAKPAN